MQRQKEDGQFPAQMTQDANEIVKSMQHLYFALTEDEYNKALNKIINLFAQYKNDMRSLGQALKQHGFTELDKMYFENIAKAQYLKGESASILDSFLNANKEENFLFPSLQVYLTRYKPYYSHFTQFYDNTGDDLTAKMRSFFDNNKIIMYRDLYIQYLNKYFVELSETANVEHLKNEILHSLFSEFLQILSNADTLNEQTFNDVNIKLFTIIKCLQEIACITFNNEKRKWCVDDIGADTYLNIVGVILENGSLEQTTAIRFLKQAKLLIEQLGNKYTINNDTLIAAFVPVFTNIQQKFQNSGDFFHLDDKFFALYPSVYNIIEKAKAAYHIASFKLKKHQDSFANLQDEIKKATSQSEIVGTIIEKVSDHMSEDRNFLFTRNKILSVKNDQIYSNGKNITKKHFYANTLNTLLKTTTEKISEFHREEDVNSLTAFSLIISNNIKKRYALLARLIEAIPSRPTNWLNYFVFRSNKKIKNKILQQLEIIKFLYAQLDQANLYLADIKQKASDKFTKEHQKIMDEVFNLINFIDGNHTAQISSLAKGDYHLTFNNNDRSLISNVEKASLYSLTKTKDLLSNTIEHQQNKTVSNNIANSTRERPKP